MSADTYSIEEAATLLGVGRSTMYRTAAAGEPIRCHGREVWPIEIAGKRRYSRRALDALLALADTLEEVGA